ncbi:MAG: alpha/beta fold hydrolase [Myxococcota bacterium]
MADGGAHVDTGFAQAEDGLRIFWRAAGPESGAAGAMVCCNGVGVSTFFWKYLVEHYADRYRVVLWDYRGHGRSDAPGELRDADLGVVRHARDMAAVMDAAGVADALLLGHSMGCQVILEFNRRWPHRVRGLVPILGTAGKALETFYDNPDSPRYFRLAARVIDRLGDRVHRIVRPVLESPVSWAFARTFSLVDPYYASADDMLPYMRHLAQIDMRLFIRTVLATNEHDAWDTLPHIRVPVLIIAAERDVFTPMWLSRKMAATIPGADFLVLADASHAAIIEQPETIYRRLDRFLGERGVFSR